MELRGGASQAGAFYALIGSATGNTPGGIPVGSVSLPLVFDTYTNLSANGFAPLVNNIGFLDGAGESVAFFSIPPMFDPMLAGITVYHAFVSFGSGRFASNAIQVELLP